MSVTLGELSVALQRRGIDAQLHISADANIAITDVTHDSRNAGPGTLFCAVRGARSDGHDFVLGTSEAGAAGALVEHWVEGVTQAIVVPDTRAAMGIAAAIVHGDPSYSQRVIGITGTNGKTTTTYLLESAFAAAGIGTGVIGTVGTRIHGETLPGGRTTPEGPDLQRLLRRMYDSGAEGIAMEVSSHGLDLQRVDGTRFAVTSFTNLTQDHLDHHATMAAYFAAKARLFQPEFSSTAVICAEGEWGQRMADEATNERVVTYGRTAGVDWHISAIRSGLDGTSADIESADGSVLVETRLLGAHNGLNAVGAFLCAVEAGVDQASALAGIAACPGVPGRFEPVNAGQPFAVVVDYAHTPDALAHAIAAARGLGDGRVHVVIGCGGDRDVSKRGPMGAVAATADRAILTSDNPRSEDPATIVGQMEVGAAAALRDGAIGEVVVEIDRRAAIADALAHAAPGDVVVIAGKGHETGQTFADETVPFDDREVARVLLQEARA